MNFRFVQLGRQDDQGVALICPCYHCIIVSELGLYGSDSPGFMVCVAGGLVFVVLL